MSRFMLYDAVFIYRFLQLFNILKNAIFDVYLLAIDGCVRVSLPSQTVNHFFENKSLRLGSIEARKKRNPDF